MSKSFCVKLPNRGLIHIEGTDRISFLQGLISNDVTKLEENLIMYACLLTPQGKFLHDFFMHWGDGFILLDCEGSDRAEDLYNRLNRYRLRADVQLSVEKQNDVYAIFHDESGLHDPRHENLGNRSFENPDIDEKDFSEWDKVRIAMGVPDGSRDMIAERSTMLECNLDKLNAIDWNKGCYMGQELTARMHHRNLGKKHIQVIQFTDIKPPKPLSDVVSNDKVIGQMRSSYDDTGLAMIRDEFLQGLKNDTGSIRLLG
ncbi:MAG: folate-binding protein [Pseudomonadota bacterium]